MDWQRVVHCGVAWAYRMKTHGEWFHNIKAFPMALKKIKGAKGKDEYVPDVDHESISKYIKDNT